MSSPERGILVPPRLRDLGMVFQSYAVWPHMTVRQNVVYPLKHRKLSRGDARRKVDEALELVGLSEYADRPVVAAVGRPDAARGAGAQHGLPAAIAAARRAACRTSTPNCACGCATICACILKQTGMTALYVTHDQAEAVVLGDRIGVMRDGKLLQMDTPDAIYNRPADLFVANFTGATNELAGTLVSRNGEFGTVDFGDGRRGEVALLHSLGPDDKVRIALRPENIAIGEHDGANIFPARVLDRRYQGTQTAYGIELFGRRLEVLELGTAARHQVGVETQVSLPRESCWAYRDTGPCVDMNSGR